MDTPLDATSHKALDLTLVIDIGKSNAKLLLLDEAGQVVERHSRANASVTSPLGYPALDLHGLQQWMQHMLRASPHALRCGHVIASTHGAAIVALGEAQAPAQADAAAAAAAAALAWEPLDYEFGAVALPGAAGAGFAAGNTFRETLSPELPAGLNAARQLHWLQHTHPEAWRRTRTLLPYAQYWAWLLSGVACSEVSSLGCHTHLWNPVEGTYSSLAVSKGWASLFAPLRRAWEVLGTVGPARAQAWGLPAACQVHVGVHDSNACLVRYFDRSALQDADSTAGAKAATTTPALTIVSSGTWTVLMAPGASAATLVAEQDMLGNVDVTGRITPTARFMGGREFAALLDGADPAAASLQTLHQLVQRQTFALPCFSPQGGPFAGRAGYVEQGGLRRQGAAAQHLSEPERATLAACYCAQVTAWLIHYLWKDQGEVQHTVVVEGPLAHNPVYLQVLQAVLPRSRCHASVDALEGTARGAWLLTRWGAAPIQAQLQPVAESALAWLQHYHGQWLQKVGGDSANG